ncbi:aspartate aminotransferase [Arthrobacter livingstonensis]|uniref:Aspartate aminotransferase n=1 Tax=Arthrobacter livingstonensis TaxID=670078 RepID=A0A2V5LP04_9MICC|nr:aminotransferase class I/II-fold pyridoxal phosphate-dependent enzyme [Arthrobacter livingstonensis]PYI69670.1 aspartate aminotransferase [Arthrobacter livingstonensis]
MELAGRLDRLGTETAFAVSQAAAQWAAQGHQVYPFHLGDIDLPTPQNIVEAMDKAIADGLTGYCPAAGIPLLREALADDIGAKRGMTIGPDQVTVHPGGKPVINRFIQALMDPADEVLYPNPGYPIYESQIEYFGGVARPYRYIPTDDGFAIDLGQLESMIGPKTKAIIFNDLQNPMGAESTEAERRAIAELALRHNLWVLSDEAYFEMRYSGSSHSIAALPGMAERTVILYTFSKKFAMTGWRLGCAVAPRKVSEAFAKLNINDESCTAHFVQRAGVEAIRGDQSGPRAILAELEARRDATAELLNSMAGISVAKPNATFYLFPDVTGAMAVKGIKELPDFATEALHATGVSFCTRLHFGRPQPGEDRSHARFAYSGLPVADIQEGLGRLKAWLEM